MIAKSWKYWMLGAVLGLGWVAGSSERASADPPWGHPYGGSPYGGSPYGGNGIVIRNNASHLRTYPRAEPRHSYHDHYHYHHHNYQQTWSHRPHYECYPNLYPGVPRSSYYRPSVPRVGISVGGWPSGPSFGGGGFPYGSPYGGGVNVRIGR